jgi:hypothetical protein
MGWISNDNLHEGYLESVLVEGARSTTTSIDGPIVMLRDEVGNYTGKEMQRSDDEITAWQLRLHERVLVAAGGHVGRADLATRSDRRARGFRERTHLGRIRRCGLRQPARRRRRDGPRKLVGRARRPL